MKFSLKWVKDALRDLAKQEITIQPAARKLDGGGASTGALLDGIYKGSNHNLSLSSYLAYGMINIPKNMIGIPSIMPVNEEDAENPLLKELQPLLLDEYPIIVTSMLVHGTAWRWARWCDPLSRLIWEAIPDASVTSLVIDPATTVISEVYTNEQIEIQKNDISRDILMRKRHFTRETISETFAGKEGQNIILKNVFHAMPIPFAHDCIESEWRGNSVFARVIRLLKANHDISYRRDSILADFSPKIVQTVRDSRSWVQNNRLEGNKFDPFGADLVVNREGESTAFLYLSSDATSQHNNALIENQKRIIMGSGVPELLFGGLATGNYASTETDRLIAIEYIKSLRRELQKSTETLIHDSLRILSFRRMIPAPPVYITWGNLSLLSEMERSQIMAGYASALSGLLQSGSISPEGAYYFTKELYPNYPSDSPENFMKGLADMLKTHTSQINASPPVEDDDLDLGLEGLL